MSIRTTAAAVAALAVSATVASADLVDFEDRAVGDNFPVVSSFISQGVQLDVNPFLGNNFVRITGSDMTNTPGPDREANINNAHLGIGFTGQFGAPASSVTFFYGEFGGTQELRVNGGSSGLVGSFLPLNGAVIGGANVAVVPTGANSGRVTLFGAPINGFSIGGQELWVDDIRFPTIPAPSALAMLGLAGLTTARRRRA